MNAEAELEHWRALHAARAHELASRLGATFSRLAVELEAGTDLLAFRPLPERWSALEVLEHVALANRYLLLLIEKIRARSLARLAAGSPWPDGPPRPAMLAAAAADGAPWPHPEHMAPTGHAAPASVAADLVAQGARCRALLEELPRGEGTLHRIRMSRLPGDGRLDLYGWIDFLGRHAERHLRQVARNRAAYDSR